MGVGIVFPFSLLTSKREVVKRMQGALGIIP